MRKSVRQLQDTPRIWPLPVTSTVIMLVQATIIFHLDYGNSPLTHLPASALALPPTVCFYQSSQSNTFKTLSQILSLLYSKLSSGFPSQGKNQSPSNVLTWSSPIIPSPISPHILFPLIFSALLGAPQTSQACSWLKSLVLDIPPAWNALITDTHLTFSLPILSFLLKHHLLNEANPYHPT